MTSERIKDNIATTILGLAVLLVVIVFVAALAVRW